MVVGGLNDLAGLERPDGRFVHQRQGQVVLGGDLPAGFKLRAKRGWPSTQPILPATGPQGVGTSWAWRRSTLRCTGQRRRPSVDVSRKRTAWIGSSRASSQSTESFTPGRFFFIWMAVV